MIIWDYMDLTITKIHNLHMKNTGCFWSPLKPDIIFCKAQENVEEKMRTVLMRCELKEPHTNVQIGRVSTNNKAVSISANGKFIGFVHKAKLSMYSVRNGQCWEYHYDKVHLSCVALHPKLSQAATGDEHGKIIVWYDICEKRKEPQSVKLHWHNPIVTDLLFTIDASYLMSAGNEKVLVIWQLETQHKTFVPRIGGAITDIFQSSDSMFIGVSLDCNMIKILSAVDSKLTRTIKFLSKADNLSAGLTYDPKTECIVLNDKASGALQFYQPTQDTVKLNLDVVGENLISSVEERCVYPTRVQRVSFSDDGVWMATVDVREDRILPVERKLKFWKYSDKDKNYILNTLVDPPHEDEIYSLTFRPPNKTSSYTQMVATTSRDGYIKEWVLQNGKNSKDESIETWQIHSMGSYDKESCKHACFSCDGSLLAVLFSEVTLWDPEMLSLQTNLNWNLPNDEIKLINFCCNESFQYLCGYSENYLIVWDIKTCSIKWQMEATVKLLAVDPYSRYFAAFIWFETSRKMHVYLFDPVSPTPVALFYKINNDVTLKSAIFTPRKKPTGKSIWSQIGHLYILNKHTCIKTIKDRKEFEEEKKPKLKVEEITHTSSFEDIFGVGPKVSKLSFDKTSPDIPVGNPTSVVIRKMMSTPTHVLPSVDVMCKAFLKSMLIEAKETSMKEEKVEEDVDSDVEMQASKSDEEVVKDKRQQETTNLNEHNVDKDWIEDIHYDLPEYNFDFIENVL